MGYRILVDENVERQVTRYLEKQGHDAAMVVDELEPGVDDTTVVALAEEADRVVLTHDDGYFGHDQPTLFIEKETLSAFRVAEIVTEISEEVHQEELAAIGTLKVVEGWL